MCTMLNSIIDSMKSNDLIPFLNKKNHYNNLLYYDYQTNTNWNLEPSFQI